MALERALFLRQQADLIEAQNKLRRSADLVIQPGKTAEARDLMAMAALDLEAVDKKAREGEEITNKLLQAGFSDIPLQPFAERLRMRPPEPGEGALARIVGDRSQIEDDLAIKETEAGLEQMRLGNREGFRASSQKAAEHSTKAERIAITGESIIQEFGDFSIEDMLLDLRSEVEENRVTIVPKKDEPEKTSTLEEKEVGPKLKRGERLLMTLNAILGVNQTEPEVVDTFDALVAIIYEEKKDEFPDTKRLVGYYRGNTKNDVKRLLELLESDEKLSSALIDSSIKLELQQIQADPKFSALSLDEKTTLAFREEGWQAILAKLKAESISRDPEQGPAKLDVRNTSIVTIMQKIHNGEVQDHETDISPITDFTTFQERIWWRAFDLVRENDRVTRFKNTKFEDVLHDIYIKEVDVNSTIPIAKKIRVEEKIRELSQNLILALERLAAGLSIPQKIERIIADFGTPTLESFSWLTPLEITQVIKRELDFESVKEIAFERWSASVTPDQANAYLQEATGE